MKLRLTRRATAQVGRILGDLASRSPQGAVSLADRLSDVFELLSQFPLAGRQTARRGVRRITIVPYPYNVDYRVDAQDIVVLGVRHASRRPIP